MADYDGQHLEVVRQVRTGLFMVRKDLLDAELFKTLGPAHQALVTHEPMQVESSSEEYSDAEKGGLRGRQKAKG